MGQESSKGFSTTHHRVGFDSWNPAPGIYRLRELTPEGEDRWLRSQRFWAYWPAHLVYLSEKKLAGIPDGGGLWAHVGGVEVSGWDARIMGGMGRFFEILRSAGFRRGPGRVVAGIGGSLAEKFGLNVWLVRLLILLSFLLPVLGVGAYLLVWVLTPWQDGSIPLERALDGRR